MQTDILLKQIQQHIQRVKQGLEEFEAAIQPDSEMSEALNNELNNLGKLVGAYSFIKQQQEISPRLDLHMKVSEKLQSPETREEPQKEETQPVKQPVIPEMKHTAHVPDVQPVKTEQSGQQNEYPKINVSINDKFRFINDLFKSNAVEYGIAIEQINSIGNWHDTQVYLNGLKHIYGWDEDNEMVKKIFSLGQKRFIS